MHTVQGLRDFNGIAVKFSKIAPGGFVVVDIDGEETLISRDRWDTLPVWGTAKPRRGLLGPSRDAIVIALVGAVLAFCEAVGWLIQRVLLGYAVVRRRIMLCMMSSLTITQVIEQSGFGILG